jgi:hypothetical protein
MSLYNTKHVNGHYEINKFDEDLNPEATYKVTLKTCECQASHRPTCRHRQMLLAFQHTGRVNTGWMLEFDNQAWFFLDDAAGLIPERKIKGHWRRA